MGRRRQVVMIGPSPASRGGMASVIATCLAHGYEREGRCRFIATQIDGPRWRKAGRALAALALFTALLLGRRVALLHVHVASGPSFWRKACFMGAARLFGCPVLLHLHGGRFRAFIDALGPRRRRLALGLLGASKAAFALSEAAAAWLREVAGIGTVELFPNPVGPAPALARCPGRDILFLGRLLPEKGVHDLVRAFALVHALRPDTRLVLAGEGDAAALRALGRQLGVLDALVLPGWLAPPARAAALARAAVFVLPSHQEQMPVSLLEAMLAGVPVVATDVGCISHILNTANCGFLVNVCKISELTASILCILDDTVFAEMTSARGRGRIQSVYLVDRVMERLRRRYEELAA